MCEDILAVIALLISILVFGYFNYKRSIYLAEKIREDLSFGVKNEE